VPPERQTWTKWTFIGYWYSDLVTISTWTAASAIVTTGLSATDAVLITLVAAICNAVPTVLNGAIGADLHIPFPIASRASFGYWLSYFCVISRGILAMFWFGVQSAQGGACVKTVSVPSIPFLCGTGHMNEKAGSSFVLKILICLWPSYASIPNRLPPSAGITSGGLLAYFLYWLLQFPLMLIPTHKLQGLFWAKTALVTPMALAMVIWITVVAGGNGGNFFAAPPTVSGSQRAWLWLANLVSPASVTA